MSRGIRIALLLAAVVVGYWVYRSCTREDDAALRAIIQEMAAAAEARDTSRFLKHFSSQYQDSHGNGYFFILQMVKRIFEEVDELEVKVEDLNVVVAGDEAFVTLSVMTEARRQGQILHPFGREDYPEQPRITFKKERLGWKIVRVEGVERAGVE